MHVSRYECTCSKCSGGDWSNLFIYMWQLLKIEPDPKDKCHKIILWKNCWVQEIFLMHKIFAQPLRIQFVKAERKRLDCWPFEISFCLEISLVHQNSDKTSRQNQSAISLLYAWFIGSYCHMFTSLSENHFIVWVSLQLFGDRLSPTKQPV